MSFQFRRFLAALSSIALGTLAACSGRDSGGAAWKVTTPGTGAPVRSSFDWLRPGYFAVRPALGEAEPAWTAAVMRTTRTPGGTGVVLTAAGPELSMLRWSWVLRATKDGLVVHRSGERVLDPPWLVVPSSVTSGMTWDIKDGDGHVVASGEADVRQESHPMFGAITLVDITVDVDRSRDPDVSNIVWTENNIPVWRRLVNRHVQAHRCRVVGSVFGLYVPTNPLAPDGGPLRWQLVHHASGELGFLADSALVPANTGPLPAPSADKPVPLTAQPLGDNLRAGPENIWNVTRVLGDPRIEGPRLGLAGASWDDRESGPCEPGAGWPARQFSFGACAIAGAAGLDVGGPSDIDEACGNATHFDTTADGLPGSVPTEAGYALERRVHLVRHHTLPVGGHRSWLHGSMLGVFRDADGAVRALANAHRPGPDVAGLTHFVVDDATITHEAVVATRPEQRGQGLDPDYPAAGHIYEFIPPALIGREDGYPFALDFSGTRVAPPSISHIRRIAALTPEVRGQPLPLFIDAFPWMASGHLERGLVEGSRVTSHVNDGIIAGYFPEPITVVRHGNGTRSVLAIEYGGAIREIAVDGGLRWRSLGTPLIPDGHIAVGAWRDGERLFIVTQTGAATRFDGIYVRYAKPVLWDMPVKEGPWEEFPGHLFPGVDVDGDGRVVCAPPGDTIASETMELQGKGGPVPQRLLPVNDRCVIVLPDRIVHDINALMSDTSLMSGPVTGLTFNHPSIGGVRVWGDDRLVELGGRLRVPKSTWDALAKSRFVAGDGDYSSLATPLPRALDNAFGGQVSIHTEGRGGYWVVPRETCRVRDGLECARTVEYLAPDGTSAAVVVTTVFPPGLPDDYQSELVAQPASDTGLYLSQFYLETNGTVTDLAATTSDGNFGVGNTVAGLLSSPAGLRPPSTDGRIFMGNALAPAPPGVIVADFTVPVGTGPDGEVYVGPINHDIWRGVVRPSVMPDAVHRLFTIYGGPINDDDDTISVEADLHPGRPRLHWVRRAENGNLITATVLTDVFGRAVEILGASASRDGALLPDRRLIPEPACSCDIDTEVCQNGTCACAPEHTRVGAVCEPILGGSFRPAPSCAAILDRYGAISEVAYVDPDGTTPMALADASGTVRAVCEPDGLTRLAAPSEVEGPQRFDVLVGPFQLQGFSIGGPPAIFEARWNPFDNQRPPHAREPLMALEVVDRAQSSQRLFARFRNDRVDLGPLPVRGDDSELADHGLERDANGRLCVTRGGVELVCRDLPDAPLWVSGANSVAALGHRCLPLGHDYGAGLCTCDILTCEEGAFECGGGNDGCFGRVECGACETGLRCGFGRCICEPDAFEREPGEADDTYYVKVGLDGEPRAVVVDGFTLDSAMDADWVQILAADAAFQTPNELRVVVFSSSNEPLTLTVGTSGCATSCGAGSPVTATWPVGGAAGGCRATGTGRVEVVYRVACDAFTIDAERGLYFARVEGGPNREEACLPWSIEVETRAATTFP